MGVNKTFRKTENGRFFINLNDLRKWTYSNVKIHVRGTGRLNVTVPTTDCFTGSQSLFHPFQQFWFFGNMNQVGLGTAELQCT